MGLALIQEIPTSHPTKMATPGACRIGAVSDTSDNFPGKEDIFFIRYYFSFFLL